MALGDIGWDGVVGGEVVGIFGKGGLGNPQDGNGVVVEPYNDLCNSRWEQTGIMKCLVINVISRKICS